MLRRPLIACMAALAVAGATAAHASGEVRYAEPAGDGPSPCAASNPCSIQGAIEGATASHGDEVILRPGTYTLGSAVADTITIADDLDIHGEAGQPRPQIVTSAPTAIDFATGSSGTRIADLAVRNTATLAAGIRIFQGTGTLERVFVHTEGWACIPAANGAVIRDSVCWNSGLGEAINVNINGGGSLTAKLRNVTAIADGIDGGTDSAITLDAAGTYSITLDARNVIARSNSDPDLRVQSGPTASAALLMTSSNYGDVTASGSGSAVTAAGAAGNQTTAPLFTAAESGDFRPLPTSPTVDAGTTDADVGATDLDLEPRVQGAAIDIGAYETAAPPPVTTPDTTITKRPKKRTRKRRARFVFTSEDPAATFECSLDGAAFTACASPYARKVKRRRHTFEVRAVNAAGAADPTPASAAWKVKRKRPRRG